MSDNTVILEVKELHKSFDGHEVLKGISTTIKKGDVLALIGPSGCGKSTFLRSLNLLEIPTAGHVLFEGTDLTDPSVDINHVREKIGMVFQQFNLFPHYTVKENIMLAPVELKLKSKEEAEKKALELLKRVGLAEKADASGEVDFTHDYSEEIKADIEDVVSKSESLQKELEQINTIIQKFTPLAEKAETQGEMNASSRWFYVIWDTELNNLWSRFMNLADQKTKESVLAEQRNWVAMKEEATLLSIGSSEENGSIYPLLQNSFLEEITKNRACVLASKLAGIKGEDFMLPDRSNKYGLFVDNQGTGNVYSALVTREGLNGENEAVISVYRIGETRGTFTDHGNGELAFASDDGNVRGIIHIDGWKGASFHVTEVTGNSAFTVGEELEFPFAF